MSNLTLKFAFVTDKQSIDIDFDMPLLLDAAKEMSLYVDVCEWDDASIDWSRYACIVLRSPWDYTNRLEKFLEWCRHVSDVSRLVDPLNVVEWNLDKRYLQDLSSQGEPVVPTQFFPCSLNPYTVLESFFAENPDILHFVIKLTIGAYSKDVKRFTSDNRSEAISHIQALFLNGQDVMIQPYLASIDTAGETDLILLNGKYNHAIRKEALLDKDGTVNTPGFEFHFLRQAKSDEIQVADNVARSVSKILQLEKSLLYTRVDMVREKSGRPIVLELEITEPSLSMPLFPQSAATFINLLQERAVSL